MYAIAVVALFAGCVANGSDMDIVGGDKSLTISLPTTRTYIGEEANDAYPVYWSEGDRIALNGVCSHEAEIDAENKNLAVFTFDAVLTYPYALTYPYTDGTNEERALVRFPTVQNYVENSTESGILPMYGYVADKNAQVKLNHLASLLRFAVKAGEEGVVLSKVVITSSSAKLAGDFEVDCTNGALRPTSDATNAVTYNLPTNFALSTTTESVFYIALPAGEAGACTVELVEQSGARMVASWSSKNLTAGIVRKFNSLTYKRGSKCVIKSFEAEYDEMDIYGTVKGFVKDSEGNPISGVAVSDGFSVTQTDANGRYEFTPSTDAWYIYVTVPAEYQIDIDDRNLPRFYQKFEPTKRVYDFTLTPLAGGAEQKYALITITDVHLGSLNGDSNAVKGLFENVAIPHINGECDKLSAQGVPCYGINLGDNISNMGGSVNDSAYREDILDGYKMSKVPFFSVFGNHDCNYFYKECPLEADSRNSTYDLKAQREHEELFGPVNYSFDRGNTHIVAMRNVIYPSPIYYSQVEYGFSDEQVAWLEQDLALVPKSKTLILCVHVPIFNYSYQNYDAVRALLNQFDKVYAMSGHAHYQRNVRHNQFNAYPGSKLVEFNSAPLSGAAWRHTIAGDGTPAGYKVYINEGGNLVNEYYVSYNKGNEATSHQMRLYWGDAKFGAPADSDNPNGTKGYYAFNVVDKEGQKVILANLFNNSVGWSLKVYENGVEMGEMTKANYANPAFETLVGDGSFDAPWRAGDGVETAHDFYVTGYLLGYLGGKSNSSGAWTTCFHMFKYTLKDNNAKVKVVATDPYGATYSEEVILGDTTF